MITAITEMSRTEGIGGFYTGYGIQVRIPSLQHPSSLAAIVGADCPGSPMLSCINRTFRTAAIGCSYRKGSFSGVIRHLELVICYSGTHRTVNSEYLFITKDGK
jgi:hypothetical protein